MNTSYTSSLSQDFQETFILLSKDTLQVNLVEPLIPTSSSSNSLTKINNELNLDLFFSFPFNLGLYGFRVMPVMTYKPPNGIILTSQSLLENEIIAKVGTLSVANNYDSEIYTTQFLVPNLNFSGSR